MKKVFVFGLTYRNIDSVNIKFNIQIDIVLSEISSDFDNRFKGELRRE